MDELKIQALIEGHLARNQQLKELIVSKGVALEDRRKIELHFWASDERAASDLAMALDAAGYPVTLKARVHNSDLWNVESQVEASPISVTTRSFIERLIRLAADHQAEALHS